MHKLNVFCLSLLLWWLPGCDNHEPPITLAMNPWPGYEMLFLAEQKGFYQQVGLNIKLYQLGSLADSQRSYLNERSDGFTSTVIEAVHAHFLGNRPLVVLMIPDFSSGGDVIIAKAGTRLEDLKGKVVGCEVNSVGIFMLYKALHQAGLSLADVTVKNVEQIWGAAALASGDIDAFVTYPPASIDVLKQAQYQVIFSSADIPGQVIDTVSVRASLLQEQPDFQKKMMQAWDLALNYMAKHPDDAYRIMAQRQGLAVEEFELALQDLEVLDSQRQEALLQSELLQTNLESVCEVLNRTNKMTYDCAQVRAMVLAP